MLRAITLFSTTLLPTGANATDAGTKATHCQLMAANKPTPIILPGTVLEQQYDLNQPSAEQPNSDSKAYLLLSSDNCPFEEGLHISLLNNKLALLDQLSLGIAYQPGQLSSVKVVASHTLAFSFFKDIHYQLTIHRPSIGLFKKNISEARYPGLPFKKHYLTIKRM